MVRSKILAKPPPPKLIGETKRIYYKFERSLYQRGILSAKNLCLPDFMGIGLARAGTTWLWSQLRCHPGLYLSAKKELHFFDRQMGNSLSTYAENFKPGSGKLKGEFTASYIFIPVWRIQYIHTLMPRLKLIVMLRDPVERAWSWACYHFATSAPARDIAAVSEDEFRNLFVRDRAIRHSDFLVALDQWSNIFSPQQILIGFYDDVQARPRELLQEIFAFLEVPEPSDWEGFPIQQIVNSNPHTPIPYQYREFLEEFYDSFYPRLADRFGERVKPWLEKRAQRV